MQDPGEAALGVGPEDVGPHARAVAHGHTHIGLGEDPEGTAHRIGSVLDWSGDQGRVERIRLEDHMAVEDLALPRSAPASGTVGVSTYLVKSPDARVPTPRGPLTIHSTRLRESRQPGRNRPGGQPGQLTRLG